MGNDWAEELAGCRSEGCWPGLRGTDADDLAAAVAAFGAEVDQPIGGLDDVEVVLDHDDGITAVYQAGKDFEQPLVSSKCSPVVGSSRM